MRGSAGVLLLAMASSPPALAQAAPTPSEALLAAGPGARWRVEAQVREFADPTRTLGLRFATDEPDRDWMEAAAGLMGLRPGGPSSFVEARQRAGHRFLDERQIALGLRLER